MKRKAKVYKSVKIVTAAVLLTTAVLCVIHRLPQCFSSQDPAVLAAAAFTFTNGEYRLENEKTTRPDLSNEQSTFEADNANQASSPVITEKNRDKSNYYDSFADHSGEAKLAVTEKNITGNATKADNFYIRNKTGLSLDFEELLKSPLTFDLKKNTNSPQVLIYHTHSSEAYMDEDVNFFYESYYSRTSDNSFNVAAVGDAIAEALNKKGISAVHDKTVHDETYNGSYDRSAQTVINDMEKYKDIKIVLDIHRDAIGTDDNKVKTVFEHNGRKGAQIMILSGCDTDGERGFDNWQENLKLALKLQHTAESMYPGMTRPISFDYFAYNEYICNGSLLIEVGTEANSIDEAVYTGELLGNVIAECFKI